MSITLDGTNGITSVTGSAATAVAGPAFSYKTDGTQSLSGGVTTKILYATKDFDTANAVTSSKFLPTVAGYYQINAVYNMQSGNTGICFVSIYKNGSEYKRGSQVQATGTYAITVSGNIYLNGSTDYVEIYAYSGSNSTASSNLGYFDGCLVRGS